MEGGGGGVDGAEGAVEVDVVELTGVRPVMTETAGSRASIAAAICAAGPAVIAIMSSTMSSPSFAAEGADAVKSISLYD